tara:strand:+ start:1603 stop:2091 length:489 start_codon:yes stop_codon:yes gene_type:complete
MALYGKQRDVLLFQGLNTELLHKIIEQQVGYYKPVLSNTPSNIYGEAQNKTWIGPVLIKCLLDRGEQTVVNDDFGVDRDRTLSVRFFRKDLLDVNVVPEIGDAVLWNEDYYEVDNLVENQLIVGKDPSYPYSDTVDNFGESHSIILTCHYTRPERLGIKEQR